MDDMLALVNDWADDPAVLLGLMALQRVAQCEFAAIEGEEQ